MDPITRGLAAISPQWARDKAQFGGGEQGQQGGPQYSGDGEDSRLRRLAANTIQPYRPGWAALPGVASSIAGGLASRKLRQNEQRKMRGERAAWGGMTGPSPDYGAAMKRAPMGSGAWKYARNKVMAANDPDAQLDRQLKQARLTNLQRQPERQRRIVKGADGRNYYADDASAVLPDVQLQNSNDQRKMVKAADGRYHFADDGSLSFPDIQSEQTRKFNPVDVNGVSMQQGPDGKLYAMPQPPSTGKMSEGAAKAASFARMMAGGTKALENVEYDPTSTYGHWANSQWVPNEMVSGASQQYRQAAMQWIRAKLRKESGAAIGKDEFEGDFRTFFPQPGDTKELVIQKAEARRQAEQAMILESRGAYQQFYGEGPQGAGQAVNQQPAQQYAAPPAGQVQQPPPQQPIQRAGPAPGEVARPGELPPPGTVTVPGLMEPQGGAATLPTVNSPQEAMQLTPGTRFITPDGRIKIR